MCCKLATGVHRNDRNLVATIITTSIGLPTWGDTIVEYVAGFAFGLLVFQALFMRDMLGGSYLAAVKSTVLPEWLSMNGVMAGMVVVMVILRSHAKGTTDVGDVRFWGVLARGAGRAGGRLSGERVAGEEPNQLKHWMGYGTSPREGWQRTDRAASPVASADHSSMDMGKRQVTRAQINAVAVLTLVVLAAAVVLAAVLGDFSAK